MIIHHPPSVADVIYFKVNILMPLLFPQILELVVIRSLEPISGLLALMLLIRL